MATYRLANGTQVRALPTSDRTVIEFVTYNGAGDVISTVRKDRMDALPMLASLRAAEAAA